MFFIKTGIQHAFGVRPPAVVRCVLARRYERESVLAPAGRLLGSGPGTTLPSPFSLFPSSAATGLASAFAVGACASLSLESLESSDELSPRRELLEDTSSDNSPPRSFALFSSCRTFFRYFLHLGTRRSMMAFRSPVDLLNSARATRKDLLTASKSFVLAIVQTKVNGKISGEEA